MTWSTAFAFGVVVEAGALLGACLHESAIHALVWGFLFFWASAVMYAREVR